MKNTVYLLLIFLLGSCNLGRQYANYRFGGKSKHEVKIVAKENEKELDSSVSIVANDVSLQKEFINYDTLPVKKLPENKTIVDLKEKTIKSNSSLLKIKTNKSSQVGKKNNHSKNYSPLKGKNSKHKIWITIILVSLVVGVIAFVISDSLFTAILISVLVAIGISLIIALAICLALFIVGWIFFELIFGAID